MTATEIELGGCTCEPLMNYLKALGVLRLISEQGDTNARAAWREGTFVLWSKFDCQCAMQFFLEEYRPTPIVSPWLAGSGFYQKLKVDAEVGEDVKSRKAVEYIHAIGTSTNERLAAYREQILSTKRALARIAKRFDPPAELRDKSDAEKKEIRDTYLFFKLDGKMMCVGKAEKDELVAGVRSQILGKQSLRWLDTALVLLTGRKKSRQEAPLLGTGGNDGNSDFSAMFAQCLPEILPLQTEQPVPHNSRELLAAALFGTPVSGLRGISIGQFDPGRAGGANAAQGMEGPPLLNPWDYVFMIEGSLFLGGAVTRRLESSQSSAVFPFVVEGSPVGYGSAGEGKSRGELWLPLWPRFGSKREIEYFLAEGRVQIGRQRATTGLAFGRAIASLGVDRGIESFVRYEFQERQGKKYLATPLGRFRVQAQQNVDLLRQVDGWLMSYRSLARGENAPARFGAAQRRIEYAIFEFCRHGGANRFAEIVAALGNAERELAVLAGRAKSSDKKANRMVPLGPISPRWIEASFDGTPEFDLALSLAGLHDRENKIAPLRANVEPVELKGSWQWSEESRSVVWNRADVAANLTAVLARRLQDGDSKGSEDVPIAPRRTAALSNIASFLARDVDDRRISDLLWGFLALDHSESYPAVRRDVASSIPVPRVYALLKLLFLHRPFQIVRDEHERTHARFVLGRQQGIRIRPEPEVIALLRVRRIGDACILAMRRLRATGITPMPHRQSGRDWRDADWTDSATIEPQRLAAALLFPISSGVLTQLYRMIVRPVEWSKETATV